MISIESSPYLGTACLLETASGMHLDAIAVSLRQPTHGHAETDEAMRDRLRLEIAKLDNVRRISELVGEACEDQEVRILVRGSLRSVAATRN